MTEMIEMIFKCLRIYAGNASDNDLKLVRIVLRQNSTLNEFYNELVNFIARVETNRVETVGQTKFFDSLLKCIISVIN